MDILGFGTDAIEGESLVSEISDLGKGELNEIDIDMVELGHFQPRTIEISEDSIRDLAESIEVNGVLQPIIVRRAAGAHYQLIAGERRLRASKLAGKSAIPAIIKTVSEEDAFAIAIVENIQRKQLNTLEEADALKRLRDDHGLSNEQVAFSVGKARTSVANLIRLSEMLCGKGRAMLKEGRAEYGHMKAILSQEVEHQEMLLQHLEEKKLSVRQFEKLVSGGLLQNESIKAAPRNEVSTLKVKNAVKQAGLWPKKVKASSQGGVEVTLEFTSQEEAEHFFKTKVLW